MREKPWDERQAVGVMTMEMNKRRGIRHGEAGSYLGAEGFELSTLQHHHSDLLLYREVLWAVVSKAFIGSGGNHNVVEER